MKKWLRISGSVLVALLLATILSLGAISYSPAAHAGSNGQIVTFSCPNLIYVTVTGTNQNGDPTTWYGSAPVYSDTVSTISDDGTEYWWVGPVTVYYTTADNQDGSMVMDSVPQQQDSDYYQVSC